MFPAALDQSSRQPGAWHQTSGALGITEENDALAIVVSEETGAISLALAGRLERICRRNGCAIG